MYYGGSRSSYNFSSDLSLSSLTSRSPSIQRVLNSDYGLSERSRSPLRDYSSPKSRFSAFRPLPGVLSGDTSPTLRRRDAISTHEASRSSPVTFHDDLGYATKPRNYYDFPSTTTGLFTSYSAMHIKKPKRIDYSDYLRPVMTDRPTLKSGYCPRSRAERDHVSNPIVRERKLIKFREMSDDVLEKIRRKISWDLPEEISSPLIDEMKRNSESRNENAVTEQVRSRDNSLSRRGSKDMASPLSGSPRPSLSRRSSGDQSLDSLSGRSAIRKQSSRSNSLIGASMEGFFSTFDSKPDDMNYSKAPMPPPRKKSIGSTHKVKKPRKSSVEILLSEEKTLNYSKVADDIRRNREISESLKKLADEVGKENQGSQSCQSEITTDDSTFDNKEQLCTSELKTIDESSEVPDRGRRRRRRESVPEPSESEEKPPESRRRCRSRFRPEESSEISNTTVESNQKTSEKFEDEAPHPVSRMHRKSVKYKSDALPNRRSSKSSDMISDSSTVFSEEISASSEIESKNKSFSQESQESNKKTDKNITSNKEVSRTLPKNRFIPDSKAKPVNEPKKILPNDEKAKLKCGPKEISSSVTNLNKQSANTEADKIDKLGTSTNKSAFRTKMSSQTDFAHDNLKTEREDDQKVTDKKYSKIDNKTAELKKPSEKISTFQSEVNTEVISEKPAEMPDLKNCTDRNLKIEKRETEAKTSLDISSKRDHKLSDGNKISDEAQRIEKKKIDQSKTSGTTSKIQDTKNSFAKNISVTGSCETEVKYSNKISEDAPNKLDLKDSPAIRSSEIQNKEKESKSVASSHLSKIETESKGVKDNPLKMEPNKRDSSAIEKKVLKSAFKRPDIENRWDKNTKHEKEPNSKFLDQNSEIISKEGLRSLDEKHPINDKFQKAETSRPTPVGSQSKVSVAQIQKSQVEATTSASKTRLPEKKEAEEIVVVCKLPKKNDLSQVKKSIPNDQNVVVSIKNSALKTVNITEGSSEMSKVKKDISSTEHKIIPSKQSMDSELESCDSPKNQGISSKKEPEINVTHTVVLKPKSPYKSVETQCTSSKEKNVVNDNVRLLKPIPDVIKSTVNAGVKADSDISDIVKSTLSKDDQSKMKDPPLGSESGALNNKAKHSVASSEKLISNEKTNTSSQPVTREKYGNSELKLLENKDRSKVPLEATSEKNLSTVKKSTSAVFGSKKDETETQNLLTVKKSSSTGYSSEKDHVNKESDMKPDLILGTAKLDDKLLHKLTKGAGSNQNLIDEKISYKFQNDKAENEKSSSNEIKNLLQKSEAKERSNTDSSNITKDNGLYPKREQCVDTGIKRTTINDTISKVETLATDKIEPSLAKNAVRKDADIKKIKYKSEKIESEVKNTLNKNVNTEDKIEALDSLRLIGKDSSEIVSNKQVNKISENKIKPIDQNLRDKILLQHDSKKDSKRDDDNLKKIATLTPVDNINNKKNVAPAYKKSVTIPDISAILQESNATVKPVCAANAQTIKKDETASLSSGNVPVTVLGEKILDKNTGKQTFKHENEATETSKAGRICNEPSDPNKSNETPVSGKVQFPKICSGDVKSPKEELKHFKDSAVEGKSSIRDEVLISNKKTDAVKTIDKEADQQKLLDKKQKLKTHESTELKTEIKAIDGLKKDIKHTSSSVETVVQSKACNDTSMKDNDNSTQESKEVSLTANKKTSLENIMPSIRAAIPLEKEKEKPKITCDNLKLPAVSDASKYSKNSGHPEPNGFSGTQNKVDSYRITRAGSVMKKGAIQAQNLEVEEGFKNNILEKPKNSDPSSDKSVSDAKSKSLDEKSSKLKTDPRKHTEIPSTDHKTDTNSEILSAQTLDSTKLTNDSQPPKPSKVKQPKLPPVPRPYNRYGLFIRPKETPKTILQSSSSSEESDTETESESESSEEPTSVVNKGTHLPNGRSPDRIEKTRTQSETSNASIYSTLSNSTTCTTFSTSSLDDEFSNEKTKTLKFRKYNIDDFVLLKLLGKGSFGKVLLAELKNSEMYFAIKCLKKDVVLEDDDVESTMIERRVLALGTQHPYMCKLYCTFQTKSYLYFVMEYLNGGDLMFHIQETGRFDEKRAMFYGAEIVSALKFLHKRGIVYRDIKLDNVMLDEKGHVRIVDFGMCQCRIYKEECMPSNFCGTPAYIAPEIVLGQKYNQSVDWWSFGILLYEMLIGRSPFQGTDEDELFWSICNEEPHFPRFLSKEAVHILGLLLVKAPSKRLGMSSCPAGDIKDHAFFSTINWDKIEKKQVPPVFKPSVSGPCDTSNFDSSFTTDVATLSPVESEVLKSMDQEQFHGFSYTNPHLTG